MKTATVIQTLSGTQDVVLDVFANYLKKADGSPEWIDEKSGIVKFKRVVRHITLYETKDGKTVQTIIEAGSFLQVANEIKKLNEETFEDVID